jgi:hypothetical protein
MRLFPNFSPIPKILKTYMNNLKVSIPPREVWYEHFIAIHKEIDKITQEKYPTDCYAGHCGPWLEDLWVKLRSLPFENFGEFIPLCSLGCYLANIWLGNGISE